MIKPKAPEREATGTGSQKIAKKKSDKSADKPHLAVLDESSADHKPILLFFAVDDKTHPLSTKSLTMDNFVFTNKKINDASKDFHMIKVDPRKVDKAILKQYKVRTAPTVVFLAYNGKVMTRVVNKSKPAKMLALMKAVAKKNKSMLKKAGLS